MSAFKPAARLAQALCLGIVCLGVSSSPAAAQTAVPCNTGLLAAAITAANATGDTLVLASGCTYALSAPLPDITGNVVIDANGSTITRSSGSAFRILVVDGGGDLNLRNAFITNGDGTGTFGGGIANAGTLTVTGSTISNSRADFAGAIGTTFGAHTTIVDSSIVSNVATQNGGGLTNDGSTTVIRSHVAGNVAGVQGGGIANAGILRIQDSEINSNEANTAGGIANLGGGSVDLYQSHVNANTAASAPGGITNVAGSVRLVATDVSGNSPTNCWGSPLFIADCTGCRESPGTAISRYVEAASTYGGACRTDNSMNRTAPNPAEPGGPTASRPAPVPRSIGASACPAAGATDTFGRADWAFHPTLGASGASAASCVTAVAECLRVRGRRRCCHGCRRPGWLKLRRCPGRSGGTGR